MNTEQKNRSTILIVDDSEMNREMLAEILKDDYDTIEAADGKEAIAAIKAHENEIDLVLLDIVMPEMDGFEVLALMKQVQVDRLHSRYNDIRRGRFFVYKESI